MDNALIRDLFNHVIAGERDSWMWMLRSGPMSSRMRDKLPPNQIGAGGQLQEWLEDVDSGYDAHRHMSHLVGFFPGDEISPFYTPALLARPPRYRLICGVLRLTLRGAGRGE